MNVTPDGRYVIVDGRRWRAADPGLDHRVRAELVSELMSARRAVRAALRSEDPAAIAAARRRVQDAKLALGERGRPWWEEPTAEEAAARRAATERSLLRYRNRSRPDREPQVLSSD